MISLIRLCNSHTCSFYNYITPFIDTYNFISIYKLESVSYLRKIYILFYYFI